MADPKPVVRWHPWFLPAPPSHITVTQRGCATENTHSPVSAERWAGPSGRGGLLLTHQHGHKHHEPLAFPPAWSAADVREPCTHSLGWLSCTSQPDKHSSVQEHQVPAQALHCLWGWRGQHPGEHCLGVHSWGSWPEIRAQLTSVSQAAKLSWCWRRAGLSPECLQKSSEKHQGCPRHQPHAVPPSIRPHTSASDLSFFLVMPVQRVTKYPLLLGKILENTPANTSTHEALAAAVRAMTQVNANINEYKRRREVGEQGHISGRGHGTGSGCLGRLSSTLVVSRWCCIDSSSSQFRALPFSCPSAILPGEVAGWGCVPAAPGTVVPGLGRVLHSGQAAGAGWHRSKPRTGPSAFPGLGN